MATPQADSLSPLDLVERDELVTWYARCAGPPRYDPTVRAWVVSRYADVLAVLGDGTRFLNQGMLNPSQYRPAPAALAVLAPLFANPPSLVASDGERHARLRAGANRGFPATPARVAADRDLTALISQQTDALARDLGRDLAAGGPVDLAATFAWPLPLGVIARYLGFPAEQMPRLRQWSEGQIDFIWGTPDEADQVRYAHGVVALPEAPADLVAARRAEPAADVTSRLLAAGELSGDEIAGTVYGILIAGHETVANAISNAVATLLDTPGWAALCAEPERADAVAREYLRLYPPIYAWLRTAAGGAGVAGVAIPDGERVLLALGAANRDPAVHSEPDTARPGRTDPDLVFGYGPHYCIGAALGQAELVAALRALTRYPGLRRARPGPLRRHRNLAFAKPRELLVTL